MVYNTLNRIPLKKKTDTERKSFSFLHSLFPKMQALATTVLTAKYRPSAGEKWINLCGARTKWQGCRSVKQKCSSTFEPYATRKGK